MNAHTNDNPVCPEDNSLTGGHAQIKKYYVKRMPQAHARIKKLWFVWERNSWKPGGEFEPGLDRFISDHKTEEEARKACDKLNSSWSLHHPDFPNPHQCCQGLWIPAQQRWDHHLTCSNRRA